MNVMVASKDPLGGLVVDDFDCDEWEVDQSGTLIISREGKPLAAFAHGNWIRVQETAE